ncbi:DUF2800 domain-containing protein [Candidatus Methylacidithermus pantelleriae]|uniref:PD-(D/E)XK endonuclease-like domain-containing protein n=1 Tax=Candidatus Methylacidithermus pantelleriae TaxID=2744239 RepID=A0A8J2BR27_9BACT|nr:DUF2800 domain-containing protein [Candidatus Methylacidithermus pantelleriae]CAF0700549.1 hypothetical protein MPNT_380009 [Candidatus Methylacidithermus pantelleriae]
MRLITASVFHRRINCPGSALLEAQVPSIPAPEALEGSRLHELLATGQGEENADIRWARETVACLVENLLGEGQSETYYEIDLSYGAEYLGRADFVAVNRTSALIVDYKFYRQENIPPSERQLALLAVGVWDRWCVKKVYAVYVNPLLRATSSVYAYDSTNIEEILLTYLEVLVKIKNTPYTQVGPWCLYCRAKCICDSFSKEVKELWQMGRKIRSG